jgi:RNA polymerase primary sigma factor
MSQLEVDCEVDRLKRVTDFLAQLDPREAQVLKLRFGFDGNPPQFLREIGATLGLTRERVRQIQEEALQKLLERVAADNS